MKTASTQPCVLKLHATYLNPNKLHPHPKNPRQHSVRQLKALVKNIRHFGFVVPVLVDAQDCIIAGHARVQAAIQLGLTEIPVICLDHLSPNEVTALMLADNKLAEMALWDDAQLAVVLKELSVIVSLDIELTGFTMGEIDLRIEGLGVPAPDPADFMIPPIVGPAVCQLGQTWLLGQHRLYCGSSLDPVSYQKLMADQVAGMIITDPPYNVKIDGHVGGNGKIQHREFAMASGEMSSAEFTQFLRTAMELTIQHSCDGSVHAIFMDWRHLPEILAAGSSYSRLLNLAVWVKNQAGMGSLYRSQHELCLIFKNGTAPHQNNVELGRNGRHRSNCWQYPGIQTMRHGEEGDLLALHPTVKPVRMIADAILDVSKRGDIILDPFVGSGTTILAAERVGRSCYAMELDPTYCDTAIQRFQQLTGINAICESTGKTFAQHRVERAVDSLDSSELVHAKEVDHV